MKKPLYSLFMTLVLASLPAKADTYVLKNGDKLEGRLVLENDTHYLVEVQIAATIKEERKIAKDDVIRIEKPDLGNIEYEKLRELIPVPDGQEAVQYKELIDRCTSFIENHSANKNVRRVIKMRDELKSELSKIEQGSVKIGGVLYPASELRENRYELDALAEAAKIRELINNRQHLQALRAYVDFRKDYQSTKANRQLLPDMQRLIQAHTAKAQALSDSYQDRLEEREKGLERMAHNDEQASRRAIERQNAQYEQLFRTETSQQVGWVTLHPFCKPAIDHTLNFSKALNRDIDRFLAQDPKDGGKIYRELHQMKDKGADEREMRDLIREAQQAGIPDRYLESFGLKRR